MSNGLKSLMLFAGIGGAWFLGTQVGFAQVGDSTNEIPEPASMSLLAGGIAAAIYAAWRHRR